jgi:hypothetical protein
LRRELYNVFFSEALKVNSGTSYKSGWCDRVIVGVVTSVTTISTRNWTFADRRWLV